jgi:hypothetical protein
MRGWASLRDRRRGWRSERCDRGRARRAFFGGWRSRVAGRRRRKQPEPCERRRCRYDERRCFRLDADRHARTRRGRSRQRHGRSAPSSGRGGSRCGGRRRDHDPHDRLREHELRGAERLLRPRERDGDVPGGERRLRGGDPSLRRPFGLPGRRLLRHARRNPRRRGVPERLQRRGWGTRRGVPRAERLRYGDVRDARLPERTGDLVVRAAPSGVPVTPREVDPSLR